MYRVLASSSRVVEPATGLIEVAGWSILYRFGCVPTHVTFMDVAATQQLPWVDPRLVVGFVHVTSDIVVTNG